MLVLDIAKILFTGRYAIDQNDHVENTLSHLGQMAQHYVKFIFVSLLKMHTSDHI